MNVKLTEKEIFKHAFNHKGVTYNSVLSFVYAMQFDDQKIRTKIANMEVKDIINYASSHTAYKNDSIIFNKSLIYSNRIKFFNSEYANILIEESKFSSLSSCFESQSLSFESIL